MFRVNVLRFLSPENRTFTNVLFLITMLYYRHFVSKYFENWVALCYDKKEQVIVEFLFSVTDTVSIQKWRQNSKLFFRTFLLLNDHLQELPLRESRNLL